MQLTTEELARFVGGDMEIQNANEDYLYRGPIERATVEGGEVRVHFKWIAKNDGGPNRPTPTWTKDDRPDTRRVCRSTPSPTSATGASASTLPSRARRWSCFRPVAARSIRRASSASKSPDHNDAHTPPDAAVRNITGRPYHFRGMQPRSGMGLRGTIAT